ncbi:hypothetical protein Agabi119p4_3064 [Agaricus bisporus var. burnettii]|uniref:GrpE protein homolog n=1 Tax=Agaricus bisporus var. burnettii TaxID=192524 RepID=A0A8H7KIY9_AGABI|nr:hypothetical protein Agabi119p4_3064 [Agaricus bisporus var. burnettii]
MAAILFNSFKASTAAISSRSLARSAPRHLLAMTRRHYSEEKPPNSAPEQETGNKSEEGAKADDKLAELTKKLEAKEAEVTDLTGRLRYLHADFINLQRNSAREKEQTRDFAITRFAGDLLETVDVLALALKSVPESALSQSEPPSDSTTKSPEAHLKDLHTGVEITHRLLLQTLFKYHVKPFDPTGDKFDPNAHEAMYQAPIPGKEPGTVIDCQKAGYKIKDRILRAAQVGVAQEQ